MLERRSLRAPITLGVVMIVLVIILLAVWIVGNILARPETLGLAPSSLRSWRPARYCWPAFWRA